MVNSAYSEKIKEWLKFSNRDKNWIAHNFCLSDEDVDKWVEDGEAPSREHEETIMQNKCIQRQEEQMAQELQHRKELRSQSDTPTPQDWET